MSYVVIHRNGAYNMYTTNADGAVFERGMVLEDFVANVRRYLGDSVADALPERLERARAVGASEHGTKSLEEFLCCNRAGPKESTLSCTEFVAKFLTV